MDACLLLLENTVDCMKVRRTRLVTDAAGGEIYFHGAGHLSDVVGDNGNKAKVTQ
jgi:hypothetical protein